MTDVVGLDQPERRAAALNALHPPGTPVVYWPGPVGQWMTEGWPNGRGVRLRRTRSPFFVNDNGLLCVFIDGEAGYVAADHVAILSHREIERTC